MPETKMSSRTYLVYGFVQNRAGMVSIDFVHSEEPHSTLNVTMHRNHLPKDLSLNQEAYAWFDDEERLVALTLQENLRIQ